MNFKPNMLFLNCSFDKKKLKALLLWFRLNLSENAALKAVEILQGLGFRSATQGAISLGLDDLKTPASKGGRVFQAQVEVALAHHEHHRGNRTPVELFQHLVDTWHRTSQDLTTEVVQLFHSTERVNPVYMMAFSGARGNISQVRQLVGMRGLMADPRGQIVGFPILSNFREGLTITEYFVSCYGARKGVVDTAIRTADAGYLTRRLADVSHHVVVRTTNCGTHGSILLRDIKEGQKTILSLANRLVGRVLAEHIFLPTSPAPYSANQEGLSASGYIAQRGRVKKQIEDGKARRACESVASLPSAKLKVDSLTLTQSKEQVKGLRRYWGVDCSTSYAKQPEGKLASFVLGAQETDFAEDKTKTIINRNSEITSSLASKLAARYLEVPVRSPLSCSLPWGVCQLCYGWGLSEGRRVTLGEAVGIIAAQSIGEPGTQLTLRTFHTGGVFSGELLNEIRAPYSGNVIFPIPLQGLLLRTPHGQIAFLTKVSGKMKIFETEMRFASKMENLDTSIHSKGGSYPYEPVGLAKQVEFSTPATSCSVANSGGLLRTKSKPFLLGEPRRGKARQDSEFLIQPSTVIFVKQKEHVINNQLLAEFSSSTLQSVNDQIEITQQVLSETAGQIWFKEIEYGNRKGSGSGSLGTYFSSQKLGGIWVLAGRPMLCYAKPRSLPSSYEGFLLASHNPPDASTSGRAALPQNLSSLRILAERWNQLFIPQEQQSKASPSGLRPLHTKFSFATKSPETPRGCSTRQDVSTFGRAALQEAELNEGLLPRAELRVASLTPMDCFASEGKTKQDASLLSTDDNKSLESFIPLITIIRGKQKLEKISSVNIFTKINISCKTSRLLHKNRIYFSNNCDTHLVFNNFILSNLRIFPKIDELLLKRKNLFNYHTYGIQNRLKRSINTRYAKTSTISIINLQNNYGVLKYNYVLGYSQATSYNRSSQPASPPPRLAKQNVQRKEGAPSTNYFASQLLTPTDCFASEGKKASPVGELGVGASSFSICSANSFPSDTKEGFQRNPRLLCTKEAGLFTKVSPSIYYSCKATFQQNSKFLLMQSRKSNKSINYDPPYEVPAPQALFAPNTFRAKQGTRKLDKPFNKSVICPASGYIAQRGRVKKQIENVKAPQLATQGKTQRVLPCIAGWGYSFATKLKNSSFERNENKVKESALVGKRYPFGAKSKTRKLSKKLDMLPLLSEIDLVTFVTNYNSKSNYTQPKRNVVLPRPVFDFSFHSASYDIAQRGRAPTASSPTGLAKLAKQFVPGALEGKNKKRMEILMNNSSAACGKQSVGVAERQPAAQGKPLTSSASPSGLTKLSKKGVVRSKGSRNFVLKNSLENVISLPPIPVLPPLAPYFNKTSFSFIAERYPFLLRTARSKASFSSFNASIGGFPSDAKQEETNSSHFISQGNKSFYFVTEKRRLQSAWIQKKRAYLIYLNQVCSIPYEPVGLAKQVELRRFAPPTAGYARQGMGYKTCKAKQFTKNTKEYTAKAFTNFISRTNLQFSMFGQPATYSKGVKGKPVKSSETSRVLRAKQQNNSSAKMTVDCSARQDVSFMQSNNRFLIASRSKENPYFVSEGKELTALAKVRGKLNLLTPLKASSINDENTFHLFPGQLVAYGDTIGSNIVTTESGQVLYIDSQKTTVRKAQTVLIYSQAIIAVLSGDWIKKGTPLMSLSYQKLVTGDIVQGLPKIEQFFEAPVLRDGTFWSDSLQAKLNQFFQEEREKLPLAEAVRKGFSEIQRVLVEGVLRVYISQGVLIADKHLEVIVRQMTCKGRILYSGDTGFLRNELVSLDKIENVNQVTYGQKALYHPQVRGITDASLESESFLSAASFQETTRVLSRDAIIGKTDLMRGLKERVIVGELIQAGTGLANNSVYNLLAHSFA